MEEKFDSIVAVSSFHDNLRDILYLAYHFTGQMLASAEHNMNKKSTLIID